MEKIQKIVYKAAAKKDAIRAYTELRKIWEIPSWYAITQGCMGDYGPLYRFLARWDGRSSPFRGPRICFPVTLENERGFNTMITMLTNNIVVIETDSSRRRITVYLGDAPKIEIDFGPEGSVFAGGDALARLIDASVKTRSIVEPILTDGSNREPDFPTFAGMAHEWGLAQLYNRGELTETDLLEKLAAMEVS